MFLFYIIQRCETLPCLIAFDTSLEINKYSPEVVVTCVRWMLNRFSLVQTYNPNKAEDDVESVLAGNKHI